MTATAVDVRQVSFYGRVSAAKDDEQVSTGQQRREMLPIAERLARGDPVECYVDESISAWSGATRPAFERLLADMDAGRVRAVVCWHLNRIARQPVDWFRFEALAIRRGVFVRTKSGEYDLSNSHVRQMAGIEALMARAESDGKSEAVQRGMRSNAEAGRWHGKVAYGYRRVWAHNSKGRPVSVAEEIEPAEAAVIREIAARIIAGDSLRRIVADLNDRGVPSPGPSTSRAKRHAGDDDRLWAPNKVRAVVTRDRNVGKRVDRGVVVGDGTWPAILDEGTWQQVRGVLADPARRTSTSSTALHLLSGVARCGVCGAFMRGAANRGTPSYKCSEKSCVTRNRRDVDDLVNRVIVARLVRPDAVALLVPERRADVREAVETAASLRARLDVAADQYASGLIDARMLARVSAQLQPQIKAAEARSRTVDDAPLLHGLVGVPDAAEVWAALPVPRRRAVVALLLEVRILRTQQGARTFDPASVEIVWR